MSDKKRKRDDGDGSSRKKHAVSFENDNVSISHIGAADECPPVLAVPIGLPAPPHLPLKAYAKKLGSVPKSQRELVLHTSEHSRLDYTGKEDFGNGSERLLRHYVGVYDPESGELKLVEARRVGVRSSLRPTAQEVADAAKAKLYQTMTEKRQTLGMEFGTKKAKKMIQTLAENAVITAGPGGKDDAASKALMEAIGESVANMPTLDEMTTAAENAKPKPRADLTAKVPKDVYPVELLVGKDTLQALDVEDWLEKHKKKEAIQTTSRFISRRLGSASQNKDITKLKVLKYLLMCIEFFQKCKSAKRYTKIPRRDELKQINGPGHLVEGIRKRFAPTGAEMSQWEVDNMVTHIAALTLFIDDWNTEPTDLKEDLRLEQSKTFDYFRELGCRLGALNEKEKLMFKLTPAETKSRKMARLILPLQFRTESRGGPVRGRR